MSLIVVTPILNELENMKALSKQLAASTVSPELWVVVDDGSTDGGGDFIENLVLPFPFFVLRRENGGGLIGGSAFTAWQRGVDAAIDKLPGFEYIMKLDADVDLPANYFASALESFKSGRLGLVGGVLIGRGDREQTLHVPGPVKLYSRAGYDALRKVPRVVGFDVMDELAIKDAGLQVLVRKDLPFTVRRPIGASQGLVHGRRRNGLVCRWTGYWFPYFLLHALRYVFRKPFGIGSAAMIVGYFNADDGPYDSKLRKLHKQEQQQKILSAIKSPRIWLNETYGVNPTYVSKSSLDSK